MANTNIFPIAQPVQEYIAERKGAVSKMIPSTPFILKGTIPIQTDDVGYSVQNDYGADVSSAMQRLVPYPNELQIDLTNSKEQFRVDVTDDVVANIKAQNSNNYTVASNGFGWVQSF